MRKGRSKPELRAAVRRGIILLDKKLPTWRRLFRIKEFNFCDPCRCILGTIGSVQLLDTSDNLFKKGKAALGLVLDKDVSIRLGFDWQEYDEHGVLTALWQDAIRGRRV